MKLGITIIFSLALVACQSSYKPDRINVNAVPSPHAYTAKAHPLGRGMTPDGRTHGYAYMILAETGDIDLERAQLSCQALFADVSLSRPARALSEAHLVTYLPVDSVGDLSKTSSRFKWGLCKRLATLKDPSREASILANVSYAKTHGPILIAMDSAFRTIQGQGSAIIADLSMVPNEELAIVIQNWVNIISETPAYWRTGADLGLLSEALNYGLANRQVVLSVMPEPSVVEYVYQPSR